MFAYEKDKDIFYIIKNSKRLYTPTKSLVYTSSQTLADNLIKDMKIYGEDPTDICSIIAFHYAYLDFYKNSTREVIESNIASGLDEKLDWTFYQQDNQNNKVKVFGEFQEQRLKCLKWLSQISLHQLAAVCVVGRALESVNVAYLAMETYKGADIHTLISLVLKFYPYIDKKTLKTFFNNFFIYFNITDDPAPAIKSEPVNNVDKSDARRIPDRKVNKSTELLRDESKHIKCEFDSNEEKCSNNCKSCPIDIKTDGDFALQNRRFDDAIAFYKRAIQKNNKFAEAWNNMGNAYGYKSDYENALKAFNEAIVLDNIYGKALFGKAITLRNMERYDEAVMLLDTILELYDNKDCIRVKEDILKYVYK